ncbi:MAG TPA: SMP-30/gluconolactonase/LRE family protein [Candidatus Eisenbergiella merdavium]|uniref:SMP-30/gluconolactonase/LRE family protein n=1 Tax=Candidatus Eisenbergiella merdavium TaxID=2838551 RepID=A0A9D2NJ20_9FIRM|nr:SMP-30/gluconolactonase/LRE family protein [Candidatus Eisenbergiella merdavium]
MQTSRLFSILPDYICTPDGMEIDQYGNLVLSCPNYADENLSGCVVKIDREGNVRKWFDVPVLEDTGVARNMGIAFDRDYNLYLCDNQGWTEKEDVLFKGRVLRIKADDDGNILDFSVVACGMEHPNGIRVRGDYMYVTQSYLHPVKHESGKLVSCVYRFGLDEKNIRITNTLEDPHILTTFITENPDCQYGADGIAFDRDGNLYVGNFGDGAVYRITFREDGSVLENRLFARDFSQLESTDGMIFDERGNLYVADFCANAIARITPDGRVERIAQSPDSDGLHGELNQPGEPILWDGRLIASCFDLVTGPGKVNTGHSMPATLAQLELE